MELREDTIPMILRRVGRKVKERAEEYKPRITGVERTKKVWFFEVGDYVVRLRAIPQSKKQQKVENMDVKVRCSCPSWRWNGPEHWAMEHEYQYGRPKGTASFPKVNDPKFRHAACKHVVAVFEYVKANKVKLEPPKGLSEMLEQLSVVRGIEDKPPLTKRQKRKKYAQLDRPFRKPYPGIQFKLQPPRGNSQHGPEQTIEGERPMSMAQLIERIESGSLASQALAVKTGDLVRVVFGGTRFEGVALASKDAPWVMRGKDGFTVVKENDIKSPKKRAWTAVSVELKGGEATVGGKPVDSLTIKKKGAYSRDQVRGAAMVDEDEDLEESITGGGAPVGDTENNWVIMDVDSGGMVSQGFGGRQQAEEFCRSNNLNLVPEVQSHRMEKVDPFMLALKREHPNVVWVMATSR